MITHLIKSINWIDVGLLILFVRMIFVGVKDGFVSELSKLIGIIVAVFVSLHFYTYLAAWLIVKTKLNWPYWEVVILSLLWMLIAVFFKYAREGLFMLFKVETNHEGFDRYAAGIVAVGRGILVCSMSIFVLLLMHYGPLTRMTFHAYSFKIAGRAAVNTYSFLYKNLVDKFVTGEHYNAAAALVVSPVVK